MLKIKHVAVCMLALAMLSAGCTNYSGNTYSGSQVRSAQTVQYGTVVSVQPVTLEEDRPAVLGTVGGGVVGGVLGNMIGGGKGNTLATVIGAGAGALLGGAGSQAVGNQTGVEVTVKLDSGRTMAVVQGADISFAPGQRVRVMIGQGTTRVVPQ